MDMEPSSASMDIFNRPPAVSEDTVQYNIYPPPDSADESSVTTLAALMTEFLQTFLTDFIWHRDSFELKTVRTGGVRDNTWMLEGCIRVGDCVDDEWFAVWLLRELTARWDVAVTVFDSDGEFLLIEAADFLPPWIKPGNAENRVWIYHSNLHLIPLSYRSSTSTPRTHRQLARSNDSDGDEGLEPKQDSFIAVKDSLKILRDGTINTKAPSTAEDALWSRIKGYPALAREHLHVTKAFLPIDVCKALSQDPALVQRAVEAFYTRDALQLRSAQRMTRFSPKTSMLTTVRLTRTAYAQLIGQRFHPPKVFGRFLETQEPAERRWRDVGMKIACGFEMLYQEDKRRSITTSNDSDPEVIKNALRMNPDYIKYIQNLRKHGYFKSELEGSKLWQELESRAAQVFVTSRSEDNAQRQSFASVVEEAIRKAPEAIAFPVDMDEQSDEWLDVDTALLDETLQQRMQPRVRPQSANLTVMDIDSSVMPEEALAQEQADRMKGLANKIEKFVDGKGTLEGAVFEDELLSDDDDFSDSSADGSASDGEMESDDALRQEAMDRLVTGIEPSDYGRMPASFYENSQRTAEPLLDDEAAVAQPAESTSSKNENASQRTVRQPILVRDKYDGVDSDDETDEDVVGINGDDNDESEEDRPQLLGDVEIDMDEEQEDFIAFAKEALGIQEDQWASIMQDRKSRGAFVPSQTAYTGLKQTPDGESIREPKPSIELQAGPNLDSFEAVMQAMDAELTRARNAKGHATTNKSMLNNDKSPPPSSSKGKSKALTTVEDEEVNGADIDMDMDAELRSMLQREDGGLDEDEPMDYNLIKNFLESFKSQSGLSGPVSTLAGRLEPAWKLPRDG